MTALLAGVTLGLASSAHCAAMCGPLVLTIGRKLGGSSWRSQLRHALVHHAGRIVVYAALALPFGFGGEALAVRGFGSALAVAAGVALLVAAVSAIRLRIVDRLTSRISVAVARLSAPVLRWASTRPVAGPLATGAMNGLLPCGLVYAALAAAAASGSPLASMQLMLGFGLGTSAILIPIAMGAASISPSLRLRLRPVGPLVLAVTAVVLIARGAGAVHRHADAAAHSAPHSTMTHMSHD